MVRILPALVGAAALGAAAVLRRRKRNALKNAQSRSKAASSKRTRKIAAAPKSRARGHAKAAAKR
jgi:hypothetical protein